MRWKDVAETFENDFRDPEFVEGYLQDALDEGISSFLVALGDVVRANRGMGNLTEETSLARESLYRSLSENDNCPFSVINQVLRSLGMQISIRQSDSHSH